MVLGQDEQDGDGGFSFTGTTGFAGGAAGIPASGSWLVACLTIVAMNIVFNREMSRVV